MSMDRKWWCREKAQTGIQATELAMTTCSTTSPMGRCSHNEGDEVFSLLLGCLLVNSKSPSRIVGTMPDEDILAEHSCMGTVPPACAHGKMSKKPTQKLMGSTLTLIFVSLTTPTFRLK